MAETTKFWLLVALVCGAFAVAEYMYACEAIRICRDRKRHTLFRILVALVLLVDCLGFLGCMTGHEGLRVTGWYIDHCQLYEALKNCCGCAVSSPVKEFGLSLLLLPFVAPIFGWLLGAFGMQFAVQFVEHLLPSPYSHGPLETIVMTSYLATGLTLCAISLAAAPIRAMAMYETPKRSWWKIIVVLYVTYWPVAFLLPHEIRDMIARLGLW